MACYHPPAFCYYFECLKTWLKCLETRSLTPLSFRELRTELWGGVKLLFSGTVSISVCWYLIKPLGGEKHPKYILKHLAQEHTTVTMIGVKCWPTGKSLSRQQKITNCTALSDGWSECHYPLLENQGPGVQHANQYTTLSPDMIV